MNGELFSFVFAFLRPNERRHLPRKDGIMPLTITRKPGQGIRIGQDIEVFVSRIRGNAVRLSVLANGSPVQRIDWPGASPVSGVSGGGDSGPGSGSESS